MNSFAWLQQHASTQGREKKKRRGGKSLTKPTHLKSKHHFFYMPGSVYVYKNGHYGGVKKTLVKILLENYCC